MNLVDTKLVFLDLQTTGAAPPNGNILEVAWCLAQACSGDAALPKAFLIKQPEDQPVPGRILSITGVTKEDMESAVAADTVIETLHSQLAQMTGAKRAVIHFAQFERPFLSHYFASIYENLEIYCTHEIAKRLFPNLPARGIRALAGYFGLPIDECKRAASHVEATVLIWRNLCAHLAECGITTFEQLDNWLVETKPAKRTKYEYPLPAEVRLGMPDNPGVYRMLSRRGDVLYVGKATSLHSRVNSYFRGRRGKDSRKQEMLTQTWNIDYTVCETALQAAVLEVHEIQRLTPPYNIALKLQDRGLTFYSADFRAASDLQSEEFPIGPFRSPLVMDSFVRLIHSLESGDFDPLMFFDELDQELLIEGFAIFCRRYALDLRCLSNGRSLLALGLWFYRAFRADSEEDELLQDEPEEAPAAAAEEEEEVPPTPEEVADKYERLLRRSAAMYWLARRLTQLMNARIAYAEAGISQTIEVCDGVVLFEQDPNWCEKQLFFAPNKPHAPDWSSKGVFQFDRLRVLHTELLRLRKEGYPVRVQFMSQINGNARRLLTEGVSAFS